MKPQQRAYSASDTAAAAAPPARDRHGRKPWLPLLLGAQRRMRIRVAQWLVAAVTYTGCGAVMLIGLGLGWLPELHLLQWVVLVAVAQTLFYIALRSGWSEKTRDPALTGPQIVVGLLFADWGFVIEGPGRAIALLPMLLVLIFGAFSLHWKKIAALTVFALAAFAAAVVMREWLRPGHDLPMQRMQLRQDLIYFAMLVVMLPAAAGLAAQLSRLRSTLRAERIALAGALAKVQRLAAFDELTGLANRRHAHDCLAMEQARANRGAAGFSVVLIDLDHFKHVNDTLGHDAGDKVLCAFADAARSMLRSCDLMARWGGEEFLILMPETTAADAHAATTRLLERVRVLPTDSGKPLSFSAGVAQWKPDEPFNATVTRADDEMYAAKRAGRNQVRAAD